MEKALAWFLTKSASISLSVKPTARTAGMKAVNTVSNGRNEPPRGSPMRLLGAQHRGRVNSHCVEYRPQRSQ